MCEYQECVWCMWASKNQSDIILLTRLKGMYVKGIYVKGMYVKGCIC